MTSPPRTVSVVALLTSMVLGVVLLIGALEIPVPTVSIQVAVEAGASAEPSREPPAGPAPEPAAGPAAAPSQPTGAAPEDGTERGDAEGAGAEAPPSAEETLRLIRTRIDERGDRVTETAEAGTRVPTSSLDDDISARPTFTPYTVAPSILNRQQVLAALVAEYPALLRDAGIGGTVNVFFFIDENGDVRDRRIDRSSGHTALDDAALNVATVFRFSPALNRDRRVPVWVSFPIRFESSP